MLQGQTKERAFLGNMDEELKNNSEAFLPDAVHKNYCVENHGLL